MAAGGRRPEEGDVGGRGKPVSERAGLEPEPGSSVRAGAAERDTGLASLTSRPSGGVAGRETSSPGGDFKPKRVEGSRGARGASSVSLAGAGNGAGRTASVGASADAGGFAGRAGLDGAGPVASVGSGAVVASTFVGAGAVGRGLATGFAPEAPPWPPRREEKSNHEELSSLPVSVRQPARARAPAASSHQVGFPRRGSIGLTAPGSAAPRRGAVRPSGRSARRS